MFFSWTPFEQQQALVNRLVVSVFARLRAAAGGRGGDETAEGVCATTNNGNAQSATCAAVSREMTKLHQYITNTTVAAGHPSTDAKTHTDILAAIRDVEAKLKNKQKSLARVLQWGNWFPENFLCMKWQADAPKRLSEVLMWTARILRGKRGIFPGMRMKSGLFKKDKTRERKEEEAIATEIVERLYLTHLFGFDGMQDHFSIRYTYKKTTP